MTKFGNQTCVYDSVGNPTTYRGKTATWVRGRKLASFDGNTFEYNAQGIRIKKNGITYIYDSQGRLLKQSNGLEFFYDANGLVGLKYNGENYVYRTDIQGNIIAILDSDGDVVVEYKYDAWGNQLATGSSTLANINPFRYRSYYFDTETGLYYLQTRYYDPETGRFLNIDSLDYADPETINGLNLYAYCGNNPVMQIDPTGHFWWLIAGAIGALAGTVGQLFSDALNGELSSWQTYVGAAAGGFVAGVASTVMGPTTASVVGSLATDVITTGLNLVTGQEDRTFEEIVLDMGANAALSVAFSYGANGVNNILSKGNIGNQLFKPIKAVTQRTTVSVFFKELASESFENVLQTTTSFIITKVKDIKYFVRFGSSKYLIYRKK